MRQTLQRVANVLNSLLAKAIVPFVEKKNCELILAFRFYEKRRDANFSSNDQDNILPH